MRQEYAREFRRPSAGQVRKQLEGLSAAIKQLQVAEASLSDHTRSFINGDLTSSYNPAEQPPAVQLGLDRSLWGCIALLYPVQLTAERLVKQLRPTSSEVGLTQFEQIVMPILEEQLGREAAEKVRQAREQAPPVASPFPRQGRPRNNAAHDFVFSLCSLYWEVTGKLPRRQHNAIEARDTGPFHHFVQTAIDPTGLLSADNSYLDDVVRDTVKVFNGGLPRRRSRR